MRSLRFRLSVGSSISSLLVILIAGMLLYGLIQNAILHEFDANLDAQLRVLAAQAEVEDGAVRLDLEPGNAPPVEADRHPSFFELRSPDGTIYQRSPSLGASNLPPNDVRTGTQAREVTLPTGRIGRQETLRFDLSEKQHGEADSSEHGPTIPVLITMARDTGSMRHVLERVQLILLATGVGAVLTVLLLIQLVVAHGLRPVQALGRNIRQIRADDLSVRLQDGAGPTELGPVIQGLNHLLERLEAAFTREKALTANVAHELRTPLYGLRTKLDVTLSRPRDAKAYAATLNECLAITISMQATMENLLTLARLDAGQTQLSIERIAVAELLVEAFAPFLEAAEQRHVQVEWQTDDSELNTDRTKLCQILTTLFDNTISHGNAGGTIHIAAALEAEQYVIAISNTGCILSRADEARVFDRFWRGDTARTGGLHCGLGLALARDLMRVLDGTITVTVTDAGCFQVRLCFAAPARIPTGSRLLGAAFHS